MDRCQAIRSAYTYALKKCTIYCNTLIQYSNAIHARRSGTTSGHARCKLPAAHCQRTAFEPSSSRLRGSSYAHWLLGEARIHAAVAVTGARGERWPAVRARIWLRRGSTHRRLDRQMGGVRRRGGRRRGWGEGEDGYKDPVVCRGKSSSSFATISCILSQLSQLTRTSPNLTKLQLLAHHDEVLRRPRCPRRLRPRGPRVRRRRYIHASERVVRHCV